METITIPKTEYTKLKRYSSAYLKIASEIVDAERDFAYDHKYVGKVAKEAESYHKKGQTIEAGSVDEALAKFRKNKK